MSRDVFVSSMRPLAGSVRGRRSTPGRKRRTVGGSERTCTVVAALIDTNILVYRFDSRSPEKQQIALDLLRRGIAENQIVLPHQAVLEFVAAVTRPTKQGPPLLSMEEALREAEGLLEQFTVLYPRGELVQAAIHGAAKFQLPWFDAHLWAYAKVYGLTTLLSEDFQHGRVYGGVQVVNPFLAETT
jgi:predicted nucleic acid-binding protein